jgi:ligand-binding sensor domain-containing protein
MIQNLRYVLLLNLLLTLAAPGAYCADMIWSASGGPGGGSINTLVIDSQNPSTIYAGTSGSGIFKSTDGGAVWSPSSLINAYISALSIDPQNPSTLYAGTNGGGVYKSTNGGESWSVTGLADAYIEVLMIDPQSPAILYAGTNAGIYKSTNAGTTWSSSGLASAHIYALAVNPDNASILFAGVGVNGVYKSTNAGATWASVGVSNSSIYSLAINPQNPSTIYAGTSGSEVYKSTDAGNSWNYNALPASSIFALAIDPQNPSIIYASTYSTEAAIYKSTDASASWKPGGIAETTAFALAINPINPASIYSGTYGSGVFRSINAGDSWTAANCGLANTSVTVMALNPGNSSTIYAGANIVGIFKSTDGSTNWSAQNSGLTDSDIQALTIDPLNTSTLYAGTRLGGVFKSINGGAVWSAINSGLADISIQALAVNPQNSLIVYAGTSSEGLFKSTDAGTTWKSKNIGLTSTNIRVLAIDPLSPATIYAGTDSGGVFRSTDAGERWNSANSGISYFDILALKINPQIPATIYAATFGGGVFKSTNSGTTWSAVNSGLANLYVYALEMDPQTPSTIYAGTGWQGVYRSTDSGTSWSTFNNGLTNRNIRALSIDPQNTATLYAGTSGGGVWVYSLSTTPLSVITIATNPAGLNYSVDETVYTSAQIFTWAAGSNHTISATTPQGSGGTRHVFADWNDGGAVSHTISAPLNAATFTAAFTTQYKLIVSVSPATGGSISTNPVSLDGYFSSGASIQLTATPNYAFSLLSWSGDIVGTINPQTLTMSAPRNVSASFLPDGSIEMSLLPGGADAVVTPGDADTTTVGYAALAVNSGDTPYGTAVFSYMQNGVIVSEAGVPASPPTNHARIFIDYRFDVDAVPSRTEAGKIDINTGIAVVNYGAHSAGILYTLRGMDGEPIAGGAGALAAGHHFARFIDQFSEIAAGFELPSDFPTAVKFASLEISSDQPLSIVAMRMTTNQRNEILFTTTPVADLTQSLTTNPIYFAQFADGGGYTSSLILLNTSEDAETGILQILDNNGLPLIVNQVGGTEDSSFEYFIQPGGVFLLQTDGFPTQPKVGWVRLTPGAGTSAPVASGVFGYNPSDALVSESGVPAAMSTTHARVYVDLSRNHNTGLAIANIEASGASITINAFQIDGITSIATSPVLLPLAANGHDAKFADQLFSDLPSDFTGVLDISSATPFAALTIRSLYNENHDFLMTTFPVADATRPAPSPVVFPQIADGGGYITEFILLSPTGAATSTLSFFDGEGIPIDFED